MPPTSSFDRRFYLNVKRRYKLLNNRHYLSKVPIPITVLTAKDIIFPLSSNNQSSWRI